MAIFTPRLLAVGTVGAVTAVAAVSAVMAAWSPTPISGQNCTPAYSASYGYGYDCTAPSPSNPSGPGGGSSSAGTPIQTPSNPTNPTLTPSVVLFPSFTKTCEQSLKDLTDPRLNAYYNDLQVINQQNVHRSLTRAEFLKLVINAAGIDVSNEADPAYSDVPSSHTLKQYIAYATRNNLVSGQNGKFRPNDTITRAEVAKVFVNAAALGLSTNIHTFSDVPSSHSLAAYIQTAYDNCLLNGRHTVGGQSTLPNGERRYEPQDNITLAETAKVLYNIVHNN